MQRPAVRPKQIAASPECIASTGSCEVFKKTYRLSTAWAVHLRGFATTTPHAAEGRHSEHSAFFPQASNVLPRVNAFTAVNRTLRRALHRSCGGGNLCQQHGEEQHHATLSVQSSCTHHHLMMSMRCFTRQSTWVFAASFFGPS